MHHRDTENTETPEKAVNELTQEIIGAAIDVHKLLGPGLLESAYEECLAHELHLKGMRFTRLQQLPVTFKAVRLECAYRTDFVVEGRVILEIKAVEEILLIHRAQLLTSLRLSGLKWGLLLNLRVSALKDGIRRMATWESSVDSVFSVSLW
jgi:GxxExxY protein